MTLLSKPYKITFQLIGSYFSELYTNPVRTKSIMSAVTAGLGNYVSQRMAGGRFINQNSFWAFVIFGFLFGGSIPHYFQEIMTKFLAENSNTSAFQLFLTERLVFMPAYLYFMLYMLSRLEGKNHQQSFDSASAKFPSVVEANFKFLSLLQYVNLFFVPPILRALVSNLIDFFWVLYISQKRKSKN